MKLGVSEGTICYLSYRLRKCDCKFSHEFKAVYQSISFQYYRLIEFESLNNILRYCVQLHKTEKYFYVKGLRDSLVAPG